MANNQQQHSSSRSRRSVRFNLEQNTTCKKYGAEYSQDAEAYCAAEWIPGVTWVDGRPDRPEPEQSSRLRSWTFLGHQEVYDEWPEQCRGGAGKHLRRSPPSTRIPQKEDQSPAKQSLTTTLVTLGSTSTAPEKVQTAIQSLKLASNTMSDQLTSYVCSFFLFLCLWNLLRIYFVQVHACKSVQSDVGSD
eukprot:scaffold10974_cov207-Skeletonema_dohrnii-CCMP3373.AAC.6